MMLYIWDFSSIVILLLYCLTHSWPLPRGLEGKCHPITANTAITSETGAVAETFGGPVDDINGSPLLEVRRMALE